MSQETNDQGHVADTWSEMDLFDLANCCRLKEPASEIAQFLCRNPDDVAAKIEELRATGELDRRIAEAAKSANDNPRGAPLP
jgi:hypothetical protein